MARTMYYYTLFCALILAIGETLVVINTEKYWPLSLDDYLAVAALAILAQAAKAKPKWLAMLPAVWTFIIGNLYAMLFTRLDPVTGSGERIGLLIVAIAAAAVGLIGAIQTWRKQSASS
ncbi:hypothetical protein [Parendozoicomonas haliclonae]|uniref:Uncharacterized protein n=1 Tax=Parendozoicomonas haliclonae TaxID=1960125 RepID=A0A1X7AHI2_9GAMM|nr:hypothetical protein [Parendozoicomonas haliclonae]SMA41588.1 hypothetical protein EHSB41UT_01277 [Parendozoicomonas haliclonae]